MISENIDDAGVKHVRASFDIQIFLSDTVCSPVAPDEEIIEKGIAAARRFVPDLSVRHAEILRNSQSVALGGGPVLHGTTIIIMGYVSSASIDAEAVSVADLSEEEANSIRESIDGKVKDLNDAVAELKEKDEKADDDNAVEAHVTVPDTTPSQNSNPVDVAKVNDGKRPVKDQPQA